MTDYTRLLEELEKLYNNLGDRMKEVETSEDEATCNNGYVIGVQIARREIAQLILEENRRIKRLLDAIFREEDEERSLHREVGNV